MHYKIRKSLNEERETLSVQLKHGLDFDQASTLFKPGGESKNTATVGIVGRDFPGIRFDLLVKVGDEVLAGQAVMRDRHHHDILFTSPVNGKVVEIQRGRRRSLVSLVIANNGSTALPEFGTLDSPNGSEIRQQMQRSGIWTSLKTRPFGHIPAPDGEPASFLINAIDTRPWAPDPASIINTFSAEFGAGLRALENAFPSPKYLCTSAEAAFGFDPGEFNIAMFSGGHPAGLSGIHINALCPIAMDQRHAWTIGYQEVISLGQLMLSGIPWQHRVISLGGESVTSPRLVTVPLGARISELVEGEFALETQRIFSGSSLDGHEVQSEFDFLGRCDYQICISPKEQGFTRPEGIGTFIPTTDLDLVSPPGVLATPFLRALLVGDVDRVVALGGLELVEEDLALLSQRCISGANYGSLLREVLEQIHNEATPASRNLNQ